MKIDVNKPGLTKKERILLETLRTRLSANMQERAVYNALVKKRAMKAKLQTDALVIKARMIKELRRIKFKYQYRFSVRRYKASSDLLDLTVYGVPTSPRAARERLHKLLDKYTNDGVSFYVTAHSWSAP